MSSSRSIQAAVITGSVLSGKIPCTHFWGDVGSTDSTLADTTHCTHRAGAMMSLSGIAVPVLLETADNAPQLLYAWTRMYHYGHFALPTMCVGTCVMYLSAAWTRNRDRGILLVATLTTVSMVPFTWVFMGPLNSDLFQMQGASISDPEVIGLEDVGNMVIWWSRLHIMRSMMPLLGALLGSSQIWC